MQREQNSQGHRWAKAIQGPLKGSSETLQNSEIVATGSSHLHPRIWYTQLHVTNIVVCIILLLHDKENKYNWQKEKKKKNPPIIFNV